MPPQELASPLRSRWRSPDYTVTATVRSLDSADGLRRAADAAGVQLAITDLDVTDQDSVDSAVEGVQPSTVNWTSWSTTAAARGDNRTDRRRPAAGHTGCEPHRGVAHDTGCSATCAPEGRAHRDGHESIGGVVAQPFNDAYCAAKFAVEGMMESLAPVAAEFGVDVILIEPGAVATNFVQNVDGLSAVGDPDDPTCHCFRRT